MDQTKATLLGAVISGVVAIVVAYITSGATFDKKLADAQAAVAELRKDLATTSSQAVALREELAKLATQLPKGVVPAKTNQKGVAETNPREPNVCGETYFMVGTKEGGKAVCATVELVR